MRNEDLLIVAFDKDPKGRDISLLMVQRKEKDKISIELFEKYVIITTRIFIFSQYFADTILIRKTIKAHGRRRLLPCFAHGICLESANRTDRKPNLSEWE